MFRFRKQLTHDTGMVELHKLNIILSIHEHSLKLTHSKSTTMDPATQTRHVHNLYTCLSAVKSFFSIFFNTNNFPLQCYPYISVGTHFQAAHCIVVLFRLTTFESPNIPWDRQRVIREIDFGETIRTWLELWVRFPAAAGLEDDMPPGGVDEPAWKNTERILMGILNFWETKILPKVMMETDVVSDLNVPGSNTQGGDGVLGTQQLEALNFADMSFDDNGWMQDVVGSGYELFIEPYGF